MSLTEEAIEVCRETQGVRRHKESWWWNEEIAALVKRNNAYSNCGKALRSAEKGVDVRRQTSANSVDAGRRQEVWTVKSTTWKWKVESRNIIEQGELLRELSSWQGC